VLGADTNVLVRFLTGDDRVQSPQSFSVITSARNQPIHICLVALVELAWVLGKAKRWPQRDVFNACRQLLESRDFAVEERELVLGALGEAEEAGCDLADAIIAILNERAGCDATATFDEDAQRLRRMVPVEARL
jgi:predicted nucleic-acid-binding protein